MSYNSIISVFQHRNFFPLTDRRVVKTHDFDEMALRGGHNHLRQLFFSQFSSVYREMSGVMLGEYLLHPSCLVLLDRSGMPITTSGKQYLELGSHIDEQCASLEFINHIGELIGRWDEFPIYDKVAVLSDVFSSNYYHYSTELMPRIRLLDMSRVRFLAVSPASISRNFQKSLLGHAMGEYSVLPISSPIRVRDPFVVDGLMSEDSVAWLRKQTNLLARRGARRIYIRRGRGGTRAGNGGDISETPEFLQLIDEYDFDVIEFSPDMTVDEQVALLDGADVVLAAHGAALTNICYLEQGIALIEVVLMRTPRGVYMEIARYLGLSYAGYLSHDADENGDIIVDHTWLRGVLDDRAADSRA